MWGTVEPSYAILTLNGVLRVVQLSVDHDLRNEDELLRLSQLGLDVEKFKQGIMLLLWLLFYLFFATKQYNMKATSSEI